MLQTFVIPQLVERGVLDTVTFMQDRAPPHFTRAVTDLLREQFGDRLIGRGFPIPWPARSPDLTPMDYWFMFCFCFLFGKRGRFLLVCHRFFVSCVKDFFVNEKLSFL